MTFALLAALLAAAPAPTKDPLAGLDARLRRGEWDALRAGLEQAAEGATGPRRAALLLALGRTAQESSAYHRYDPQGAEAAVMRAVDAARTGGDAAVRARARLLEGKLRYWQGFGDPPRWDEARRILEDARQQLVEVKAAAPAAEAAFYLGLVAQQEGRWEAARPLFQDALAQARRLGDGFLASFPERHLADLAAEAKDLAAAEAGHRRCLALREQAGATALVPFARVAVAEVLTLRGRRAEAMTELRRAADEAHRRGTAPAEAAALLALSRLSAEGGDAKGAAAAGLQALAAARAYGDPELVAEAERAAGAAGGAR
ncbi:MAG: tetratricopeptide repeat protein [Anaeromyxobacteraceae bacterium]